MANEQCIIGVRHEAEIIALQERTAKIELMNDQQWSAINEATTKFEDALREIGNRIPNWAAVGMTAAGTVAGVVIGVLSTLVAVK
jgi:hypothetical protein